MNSTLCIAATSALLLSWVPAAALDVGRLETGRLDAMSRAAARVAELTAGKIKTDAMPRPSSPEIAEQTAILCRPDEAERLTSLPTSEYRALMRYAGHLGSVVAIYGEAADEARPKRKGTGYTRDMGACFDAMLWTSRAILEFVDRIVAEDPGLLKDAKARGDFGAVRIMGSATLEGALEGFAMDGIGIAWCSARLRPVLAVIDTVARISSSNTKEKFRGLVRSAERCGPAAKAGLRPAHQALAR